MTHSLAMFRVLSHADVNPILPDDGCRNNVIACPSPSQFPYRIFGVAVELPDQLSGFRFEGVDPTVAAGKMT